MTIWTETHETVERGGAHQPVRQPAERPGSDEGAGLDLSIFGKIAFHLGHLADKAKADQERKERLAALSVQDHQVTEVGSFPSSGQLFLDLGGVPLGRVWQVRRIVVGGPLVTGSPAGTAYAFAQGGEPRDLSIVGMVDSWTTLPGISKYGTHQLWMVGQEHLWIAVDSGTAGDQYAASARIEDWPEELYYSTVQAVVE